MLEVLFFLLFLFYVMHHFISMHVVFHFPLANSSGVDASTKKQLALMQNIMLMMKDFLDYDDIIHFEFV